MSAAGSSLRPVVALRVRVNPRIRSPAAGVPTFGTICDECLSYAENVRKVRRSTLTGYRKEIDRVLIPEFGRDTPAEDITTVRIEDWQEDRLGDDVKADTVNHNVGCLRRIYRRARKTHGIGNPAAEVENVPVKRSDDYMVLAPDEVVAVAAKATGMQDRVIVTVAAFRGLRLSGLRALRWRDVRWTDSLSYVRKGHVEGVDDDPKSGRLRAAAGTPCWRRRATRGTPRATPTCASTTRGTPSRPSPCRSPA